MEHTSVPIISVILLKSADCLKNTFLFYAKAVNMHIHVLTHILSVCVMSVSLIIIYDSTTGISVCFDMKPLHTADT